MILESRLDVVEPKGYLGEVVSVETGSFERGVDIQEA